MFRKVFNYLNPIDRLGKANYSFVFPLIFSVAVCILSEVFAYLIVKNPNIVGVYIIFINVASIIYFAFRDGIKGGVTTSLISIAYYFYIIYDRNYVNQQLISGIETTVLLGVLYLLIAIIIGWLKQTIDKLIDKEADEKKRLQAIIAQLPVGVIITNGKGFVEMTNKELEVIMGRKIQTGLIVGKDQILEAKRHDRSINLSHDPLAQILQTGKPIQDKEFVIEQPNGKVTYVSISTSLVKNNRGVIAAASIINDISAQKEMENRKDDFVNMASHELKTPVTSITLYLDILTNSVKQYKDEKLTKIVKNLKNQTQRLQELVNDMLDVSRLQTGKLRLKKEEFKLDELIQDAIDPLQETAKKRTINFQKKKPVKVTADKFRIYQVLTNLITNALKFSPEEGDINVALKLADGKAIVSVQDFGIGIEKSQQKKIFKRLYQVSNPGENAYWGLGMGLYISKEILTRHHGNIWVESERDKGSTFLFTLPLSDKK